MKKSLFLFVLLLTLCLALISCGSSGNEGEGGNGNGSGSSTPSAEPENLIYNSTSDLYFIMGEGVDETLVLNLQNSIDVTRGKMSNLAAPDSEAHKHEIVIGNTDRDISVKAYSLLDRIEKSTDNHVAFVIYSDGSSIAIVYDEDDRGVAEQMAVDYFNENYVSKEFIAAKGELHSYSFDIVEDHYRELDNKKREQQWAELKNVLDDEYADEFVQALQQLYSLYTPDVVTWLANLYEPNICICYGLYGLDECEGTKYCGTAGFYFSNSGRDTIGYLPDVESTAQSLGVLESWGLSHMYGNKYAMWLPEEMKLKMGLYAQALQDENGFFYHPQWGKDFIENNNKDSRKARDLGHATGLISLAGLKPLYTTPTGVQGSEDIGASYELTSPLGKSTVSAVSKVVLTASEKYAEHLENEKTFREYLDSYDIRYNSYSVGNRIGSQVGQIQARDKVIGTPSDPTPLMDELIDYLTINQNPETGCWNWRYIRDGKAHTGAELYESVNGLLKIGGDFTSAGVVMPYAEEAARTALLAVMDPTPIDAVTSLYNTWFAFRNILTNLRQCGGIEGNERADALVVESRAMAIEGIRISRDKIAVFKKDDGSFSYGPKYSSQTSQGCQVALPNSVEGDVNGTVISIMGIISNLMKALELQSYTPILFGEAERLIYLDIINNASSVKKNEVVIEGDPITFDDEDVGEQSEELSYKLSTGTAIITENPKGDGNALKITTYEGGGDYITVPNQTNSALAQTFVFESDFLLESSSIQDDAYFVQFYMGRDNYTCYFFTFTLKNGEIFVTEHSSTSWATSVTESLGKVGNLGEWFKIRAEYYYSESMDDVRIKFYYDDDLTDESGEMTLLAVTDNFYDASGNKYLIGSATPVKYYEYTKFYMMSGADAVMYMDNCMSYKVQSSYVPVTDPGKQPQINVDPPESAEKIYGFDGEEIDEGITANAGSGEILIKDNALNIVANGAADGPSVYVPVNVREHKAQCVNVSFDISLADAAVNSTILRINGLDGSKEMFGLDIVVREDNGEKYLTLREYNGSNALAEISSVKMPFGADKKSTLSFKYFHREDRIVIYLDGEFLAATSVMYTDGIKGTMDGLKISTVGSAEYDISLDNIKVEKVVASFLEAVAPTILSKPHTFESADNTVTMTGNASISSGVAIVNSTRGAASISVPMHTRSNLYNVTKFSGVFKFDGLAQRGELERILFNDEKGNTVFALALVYDGVDIDLCQVAEGGTVSEPICSYEVGAPISLTLEIYQENKMVHIIENGAVKAKTSVFYTPANLNNHIAAVTVASSQAKCVLSLDDVVLEEYYTAYKKTTVSSKVHPNEKISSGLNFELCNSGKLPDTGYLSTLLNTPLSAVRIERLVNTLMTENNANGEWSNVFAMDTGKGGNDSVLISNYEDNLGGYTTVTFEADMKLDDFSSTAFQLFFSDKSRNNKVYMLTFEMKDGKLSLTDNSSNSYKDNPNVNTLTSGKISEGEWFRLKVEIYKSTKREDVRFKIYVNDELISVSDNFYHSHDAAALPKTDCTTVQIMTLADAVGTIYLDNVSLVGSNSTCKDNVTIENSPNK